MCYSSLPLRFYVYTKSTILQYVIQLLGLHAPTNQCTDAIFSANHIQNYKPIAMLQDLKMIYQDLKKITAELSGL